jgi:hypothetical protein
LYCPLPSASLGSRSLEHSSHSLSTPCAGPLHLISTLPTLLGHLAGSHLHFGSSSSRAGPGERTHLAARSPQPLMVRPPQLLL